MAKHKYHKRGVRKGRARNDLQPHRKGTPQNKAVEEVRAEYFGRRKKRKK